MKKHEYDGTRAPWVALLCALATAVPVQVARAQATPDSSKSSTEAAAQLFQKAHQAFVAFDFDGALAFGNQALAVDAKHVGAARLVSALETDTARQRAVLAGIEPLPRLRFLPADDTPNKLGEAYVGLPYTDLLEASTANARAAARLKCGHSVIIDEILPGGWVRVHTRLPRAEYHVELGRFGALEKTTDIATPLMHKTREAIGYVHGRSLSSQLPTFAELTLKADTFRNKNDYDTAVIYYTRALALNDSDDVRSRAFEALAMMGRYKRAVQFVTERPFRLPEMSLTLGCSATFPLAKAQSFEAPRLGSFATESLRKRLDSAWHSHGVALAQAVAASPNEACLIVDRSATATRRCIQDNDTPARRRLFKSAEEVWLSALHPARGVAQKLHILVKGSEEMTRPTVLLIRRLETQNTACPQAGEETWRSIRLPQLNKGTKLHIWIDLDKSAQRAHYSASVLRDLDRIPLHLETPPEVTVSSGFDLLEADSKLGAL